MTLNYARRSVVGALSVFAFAGVFTHHPQRESAMVVKSAAPLDTAVFAGGCFWGIEAVFEHIKGVKVSESGYAGGKLPDPSYEEVGSGRTGHAESVRVIYDPSIVSYKQLLKVFFTVGHDPTQLNRQGPDYGPQYRSAVFFKGDAQHAAVVSVIDSLAKANTYKAKIVTEVSALNKFYMAEDYHQDYLALHPTEMYIMINDVPKVKALQRDYPDLWKK